MHRWHVEEINVYFQRGEGDENFISHTASFNNGISAGFFDRGLSLHVNYDQDGELRSCFLKSGDLTNKYDNELNRIVKKHNLMKDDNLQLKKDVEKGDTKITRKDKGDSVEFQRFIKGDLREKIIVPKTFDRRKFSDKLDLKDLVADPIKASPQMDRNWRTDLRPAFSIEWTSELPKAA